MEKGSIGARGAGCGGALERLVPERMEERGQKEGFWGGEGCDCQSRIRHAMMEARGWEEGRGTYRKVDAVVVHNCTVLASLF